MTGILGKFYRIVFRVNDKQHSTDKPANPVFSFYRKSDTPGWEAKFYIYLNGKGHMGSIVVLGKLSAFKWGAGLNLFLIFNAAFSSNFRTNMSTHGLGKPHHRTFFTISLYFPLPSNLLFLHICPSYLTTIVVSPFYKSRPSLTFILLYLTLLLLNVWNPIMFPEKEATWISCEHFDLKIYVEHPDNHTWNKVSPSWTLIDSNP